MYKNKPQILYVDDEPFNLMLFQAYLENQFDVITVDNGIAGLEIIKNNPNILIVFSDLKMPKMDGYEFVNRAYSLKPSIAYYMVTGYDINEKITHLVDSQILKSYFCKPFKMNEIITEINIVLSE
ncbi:MAG: response regulator [Flavobacteriaceae bacterium]|nr:MAG: response regulator [Flavobacteriaceae bacterium]